MHQKLAVRLLVLIGLCFGILVTYPHSTPAVAFSLDPLPFSFSSPVAITHAGDASGRLFVTEQPGRIKVVNGSSSSTYLDITSIVTFGGEQGLLSVAFHPNFESNGLLYVYFTNKNGDNEVDRFTASPPGASSINFSTRQLVLPIPHPTNQNHNGGQLQFGPDGYLYIGTGDGGGAGDVPNNAQNLGSLLGKILRIDINGGPPYSIPAGNPFADGTGPNRDEIWHYGLRNPWRFSFDRANGDMYIGDVGQASWEEIDFAGAGQSGKNFGWRIMEGNHCYNPSTGCSTSGLTFPILEYSSASPNPECAVTGGYIYRGSQDASLYGRYIFGDYCSGKIWSAVNQGGWSFGLLSDTSLLVSTFGEDEAGELYVADLSGSVYRLTSPREHMDVFARGSDQALWHKAWLGNTWSAWDSLGGTVAADPGAVSWGADRTDVFIAGGDSALWHMSRSGLAWSGWEALGGTLIGGPDVSSWQANRLDIFIRGSDNSLWHKYWNNGWSGWELLGGVLTADPSAASWAQGRIDVLVRGSDSALWHKYWSNGWSNWESLGGELRGSPDAASWGSGRLDIFIRGTDDALWHKYWSNGWSAWERLGGILTGDPSVTSWGQGRLDVFIRGSDDGLWHISWTGAWSGWDSLGGTLTSGPDSSAWSP